MPLFLLTFVHCVGEFVEVAQKVGMPLNCGFELVFYNGATGLEYASYDFMDVGEQGNSPPSPISFRVFQGGSNFLQNGAPDGIAIVDNFGYVIEFLSYEGEFLARDGPAKGLTSVELLVDQEPAPAFGSSISRIGTGCAAADFEFTVNMPRSLGDQNEDQVFEDCEPASPVGDCEPSSAPSSTPSAGPSSAPSAQPSSAPSSQPSSAPSSEPSSEPSSTPSSAPSSVPSGTPSSLPSSTPSLSPSSNPSGTPSALPSSTPSLSPSSNPTEVPRLLGEFGCDGGSCASEDNICQNDRCVLRPGASGCGNDDTLCFGDLECHDDQCVEEDGSFFGASFWAMLIVLIGIIFGSVASVLN